MDRQPLPFPQVRLLAFLLLGAGLAAGEDVDALLRRAEALDERNDNREALPLYLEAGRLRPGDPEILRLTAKQYSQLMEETASVAEKKALGQKALAAAEEAVRAGPNHAKARLALAIISGKTAFLESPRRQVEMSRLIKEEAEAAARLDPGDDYAWHVLGRWNYELANFNPVLKALAQTIYGKFPDASNEKAAEHLRKAVAINPHRVIHRIELGRTYLALGEREKARTELEKGLSLPSRAKDDEETKKRGRLALERLK